MGPDSDKRVDELRQQLKSLGYLDAGVDRFVLGAARDRRGPIAVAIRASTRVGLLGGVLLGPAAALGLGSRLPGLISGARDAIVLALYLAVVFFAAVTIASFMVSAASAALARGTGDGFAARARRASQVAAWIFTIASLLYLTLWWRTANAGFGWSAPWWTSFALLVAVAISLLLGHAVRIATLAVLAARRPGAALPPITARSWRPVVGGGALAFAGAAALLVSTAAVETPRQSEHTPLTVISSGKAVRLIAIDGFDAAMFDAFTGDLSAQTFGTRIGLQPHDTSDPARAWTTIATGAAPDVHGVHAIETRRVAGVRGSLSAGGGPIAQALRAATDLVRLTHPSVASRDERRVKTVWEVAEEAGLRTAVVNWWATWPAPPNGGIVITDRALLRLEQGGTLDAEISPASLYEPLRAAWPGIRERARAAASQMQASDPETRAILARSAELDATVVGILDALPGPARDLDVVYLPGLDIAQHALLARREGASDSASALAARLEAIRSYYAFLRRLLEPLTTPSSSVDVAILAEPGRVDGAAPGILAVYRALAPDTSRGGGADSPIGYRTADASGGRVEDIAPTLLAGLGIPLSRELTGSALGILHGHSVRYVDSYGRPSAPAPARNGKPLDQETIDRLRSLGYIK